MIKRNSKGQFIKGTSSLNGMLGKKHLEETKEKMSITAKKKGFGKWMQGKKLSEETRQKISNNNAKYWLGKFRSQETIQKISKANKGKQLNEDNPNWKEKVSINGIHRWVVRHKGKPQICVDCDADCKERKLHWANIDHKYTRNLNDYIARCYSCHGKYDKKNGLRKQSISFFSSS